MFIIRGNKFEADFLTLKGIISDAVAIGIQKAKSVETQTYMSLRQAYKKYGQYTVKQWIEKGLIEVIKDGPRNSRCRISVEEIEILAAASNRMAYHKQSE